jgi:hypothetical protein
LSDSSTVASRVHEAWVAEITGQARLAGCEGDLRRDIEPEVVAELILSTMLGALTWVASSHGDEKQRLSQTCEILLSAVTSEESLPYYRDFSPASHCCRSPAACTSNGDVGLTVAPLRVCCETSVVLFRILAAASVGAAAIFSVAAASAAPSDDQAFIAALDRQGIKYPSPQFAVSIARDVCTLLDDGATGVDVAREINKNSGIPVGNSGAFVGASIVSYCPSHADAFSG